MQRDRTTIEDPSQDPRSAPFLFIPLFKWDNGDPGGREGHPNIAIRDPFGVQWEQGRIILTVANSGLVASDLIRVDYQIRLCSFSGHGRADGFVVDHAGEEHGSTASDVGRIDFVPARASHDLPFKIKDLEDLPAWPDWLASIYFRARVSSLFSPARPVDQWDFSKDPAVTEATLRLAL